MLTSALAETHLYRPFAVSAQRKPAAEPWAKSVLP